MVNYGKVALGVAVCILAPGILQCVGFFKDEWATGPNSTCPTIHLTSNCTGEDFSIIHGLELYPTMVFILPIVSLVCAVCSIIRCSGDECEGFACLVVLVLGGTTVFCVIIFPFAGILILTGCIMFSTHFDTSDLGPSFWYCIAAGIVHIGGMVYIIYNIIRKKRKKEDSAESVEGSGYLTYIRSTTIITIFE